MYLVIVLILVPTYEKVQHAYTTAREFSQDMAIEVKADSKCARKLIETRKLLENIF